MKKKKLSLNRVALIGVLVLLYLIFRKNKYADTNVKIGV